jgi:hypothetical protein
MITNDREWRREWRKFKRKRRKLEYEMFSIGAAMKWEVIAQENDALGVWDRWLPWWMPPWIW